MQNMSIGGGDQGEKLIVTCIPDSTFKDEITALLANNETPEGRLVAYTGINGYEVTSPADGGEFDGRLVTVEKDGTSYLLGVELFSYKDQNDAYNGMGVIANLAYSGTIAIGDTVVVSGDDYDAVKDGGEGGRGKVIAKDTANETVDVLF